MVSFRHSIAVCALLAAVAVLGAACGGGSKSATTSSSNSTIATANSDVGSILVNCVRGETLYLFAKDTGADDSCSGACAKAWRPYSANGAALHVGSSLKASLLTSMTRADGTKQLTYNGHPLYTFSGDSKAGDITGQGSDAFGARWYVVSPKGAANRKGGIFGAEGGLLSRPAA